MSSSEVWTPDVVVFNAAREVEWDQAMVQVYSGSAGEAALLYWSRSGRVSFQCSSAETGTARPVGDALALALGGRHWPSAIDMSTFPYDTQRCELVLGSWGDSLARVDLQPLAAWQPFEGSLAVEPSADADSGVMTASPQWKVYPARVERLEVRSGTHAVAHEVWPRLHFYLVFERYYEDYVLNILAPVAMAVFMGMLAFVVPVGSGERIGLGVTCVLTVVAVMFITNESLPPSREPTALNMFYMASVVFSLLPLAVTSAALYLERAGEKDSERRNALKVILDVLEDNSFHSDEVNAAEEKDGSVRSLESGRNDTGGPASPKSALNSPRMGMGRSKSLSDSGRAVLANTARSLRALRHASRAPNYEETNAMLDQVAIITLPLSYAAFLASLLFMVINEKKSYQQGALFFVLADVIFVGLVALVRLLLFVRHKDYLEATYAREGLPSTLDAHEVERYRSLYTMLDQDKDGVVEILDLCKVFGKV